MIIRTKSGEFKNGNTSFLLDFLGVKKETSGVHKVLPSKDGSDVELIASVPFHLTADKDSEIIASNEKGIEWTFSTFDLDRYGERIDPLGWDFSQYVKNPVIEWAHCYHIPAIGRAVNIRADENGLHGSLIFNDKSFDAFGWSIGERVKAGVICAGSVGFRVMEIEIPSKEDSKDGTSLIFRKQELLEFSVCNVPANQKKKKKMRNEELEMRNEKVTNVIPFWNNLINNN
jgi:HK97 family phage prohead protease